MIKNRKTVVILYLVFFLIIGLMASNPGLLLFLAYFILAIAIFFAIQFFSGTLENDLFEFYDSKDK